MEIEVLTHKELSLDYLQSDKKGVALVVNGRVQLEKQVQEGNDVANQVNLFPRNRFDGYGTLDFNPGNVQRQGQTPVILGVWENFLPDWDAVLQIQRSQTNSNEIWLLLIVKQQSTGNQYYARFTELALAYDQFLQPRDCYTKALLFVENGHFFVIIQDLVTRGNHYLIDLWLSQASEAGGSSIRVTDFGFVRPFGNFLFDTATNAIQVRNLSSFNAVTKYVVPNLPNLDDRSAYTATFTGASFTAGTTFNLLNYTVSKINTGYYYETDTRHSKITLPVGDVAVKVPDPLASLYLTAEDKNPGFYYTDSAGFTTDTRLGFQVVTNGIPVGTVHTSTETPATPVLPATNTNNVVPAGFKFIQFLQAKGSNFSFNLMRSRLMPPINGSNSVFVFTASGTPHVRFGVSFGSPDSASFVTPTSDRPAGGVVIGSTVNCYAPLIGSFVNAIQMTNTQAGTSWGATSLVWVPFTQYGRCHNPAATPYVTPLFGLNVGDIKDFYELSNGRLACVTKNNEIYVSSPIRTNLEFPSFLDFQIRTAPLSPVLNAEVYKLAVDSITSVVASQTGYLVTTTEGLFSINNDTGIISKVADGSMIAGFFSSNSYICWELGIFSVYQYDDNQKDYILKYRGQINSELASLIGTDSRLFARELNKVYISRKNTVLKVLHDRGVVLYLDEFNVLHKDTFFVNGITFYGKYCSVSFPGTHPSVYNQVHQHISTLKQTNNANTDNYPVTLNYTDGFTLFYNSVYGYGGYQFLDLDFNMGTVATVGTNVFNNRTFSEFLCMVLTNASRFNENLGDDFAYAEYTQQSLNFKLSNLNPSIAYLETLQMYNRFKSISSANTSTENQLVLTQEVPSYRMISRLTYNVTCFFIKWIGLNVRSVKTFGTSNKVVKR